MGDGVSYYGHVKCFLWNMSHGVYPFWDPTRDFGTVSEFYMRRIGEFNPLFWVVILLQQAGIDYPIAYQIFLGLYFLLGLAGFYLLANRVLQERTSALVAFLLLLFSAMGGKVFESFLLYEITPTIWFFYFLTAFTQTPQRVFLLGLTFTLMVIAITYIPFYFLTAWLLFVVLFGMIFWRDVAGILKTYGGFIKANKKFTAFCLGVLLLALLPGGLWYSQTSRGMETHEAQPEVREGQPQAPEVRPDMQGGEALSQARYEGSASTSTASIDIRRANEGGILGTSEIRRSVENLTVLALGDFYIPLFSFLLLAAGAFMPINRKLLLLAVWGFVIYLIGLADATPVHGFFYKHVFFFKYFRNLHIFLWLVILPVFILFTAELLRLFLQWRPRHKAQQVLLAVFVLLVHVAAAMGLFWRQEGFAFSSQATVFVSAMFFLSLLQGWLRPTSVLVWVLLSAAVVAQPMEILNHMTKGEKIRGGGNDDLRAKIILPKPKAAQAALHAFDEPRPPAHRSPSPYFGVRWFYALYDHIDYGVFANYSDQPFIAYDRLERFDETTGDINKVQEALAHFDNTAFIAADTPDIPLTNGVPAGQRAHIITEDDQNVRVVHNDVNTVTLKTKFDTPQFLVYTSNYHHRWMAWVDSKPARLVRTNVAFKGLWVPAGEHTVHLRYGPAWHYVLNYFLLIMFGFVFGYLLWLFNRQRHALKSL